MSEKLNNEMRDLLAYIRKICESGLLSGGASENSVDSEWAIDEITKLIGDHDVPLKARVLSDFEKRRLGVNNDD